MKNIQVIDCADDCVYDIFVAVDRAKRSLAESGQRTRTRTETAGTAHIPSSRFPAIHETTDRVERQLATEAV